MHSYIFRKNHEGKTAACIKQIISKAFFIGHIHCIEILNGDVRKNHDTVNLSTALAMACKNRNQQIEIHRFENVGHRIRQDKG